MIEAFERLLLVQQSASSLGLRVQIVESHLLLLECYDWGHAWVRTEVKTVFDYTVDGILLAIGTEFVLLDYVMLGLLQDIGIKNSQARYASLGCIPCGVKLKDPVLSGDTKCEANNISIALLGIVDDGGVTLFLVELDSEGGLRERVYVLAIRNGFQIDVVSVVL